MDRPSHHVKGICGLIQLGSYQIGKVYCACCWYPERGIFSITLEILNLSRALELTLRFLSIYLFNFIIRLSLLLALASIAISLFHPSLIHSLVADSQIFITHLTSRGEWSNLVHLIELGSLPWNQIILLILKKSVQNHILRSKIS